MALDWNLFFSLEKSLKASSYCRYLKVVRISFIDELKDVGNSSHQHEEKYFFHFFSFLKFIFFGRRETILLKLLVIPNDDLKLMVMRCLSKVPLSACEQKCCLDLVGQKMFENLVLENGKYFGKQKKLGHVGKLNPPFQNSWLFGLWKKAAGLEHPD